MNISNSSAMAIFGPGLLLLFVDSNSLLYLTLITMFFSTSYPFFINNSQTSHLKSSTLKKLELPIERQKIFSKLSKYASDVSLMKSIMSKRRGVRRDYISAESLSDHIPFLR